ncbi:MAG: DUF167 domain-containing protein [Rhodobacteraceae bacterium]|nr:DUF167 domain-containing protein [Paracoccaceae bacterium]
MSNPWRVTAEGLEIVLRLTPKGGADRIDGVGVDVAGRPVLLVRVSVPPVDGGANKALIKLLAKTLKTSKSSVQFIAGETARLKRLRIVGDGDVLNARMVQAVQ